MPRTSMLESLLSPSASPRASTPQPERLPAPAPGTALAAGASHLVEAPTTEQALVRVNELLGSDARIVDARRVRRGGIGGFFAQEIVQLHAASAERPGGTERGRSSSAGAASGHERTDRVSSPVDRLLAGADAPSDDVDFATYLRDELSAGRIHRDLLRGGDPSTGGSPMPGADGTAATAPADEPMTLADLAPRVIPWQPPVADPPAPTVDATPPAPAADVDHAGWSREALLRLGLPVELVTSVERAEPTDDPSWTVALTDALRPSCRPLPAGPSVLVGPRAQHLGGLDGGDIEIARSRTWLAALRPGRWVHLVVGGDGWRASLDDGPLAVSWTRPDDLPDALRCAVELGLVLGFRSSAGRLQRAEAFEVALAVRDLVMAR